MKRRAMGNGCRPWYLPIRFFASALTMLLLCGCSDPADAVYPVHGMVRFPDGKVLRDGRVEFAIQNRDPAVTARAKIRPDGTFSLGTYELSDGAHAGTHKAVVISDHTIGNGAERPGLIPEATLHPRYRDFRTSGLQFVVEQSTNNIVIDVDYADPIADGS